MYLITIDNTVNLFIDMATRVEMTKMKKGFHKRKMNMKNSTAVKLLMGTVCIILKLMYGHLFFFFFLFFFD